MLWFLSIAAKRGFLIDHYRDEAVGVMEKDSSGKLAMDDLARGREVAAAWSLESQSRP